jgi:hypothetical protein
VIPQTDVVRPSRYTSDPAVTRHGRWPRPWLSGCPRCPRPSTRRTASVFPKAEPRDTAQMWISPGWAMGRGPPRASKIQTSPPLLASRPLVRPGGRCGQRANCCFSPARGHLVHLSARADAADSERIAPRAERIAPRTELLLQPRWSCLDGQAARLGNSLAGHARLVT